MRMLHLQGQKTPIAPFSLSDGRIHSGTKHGEDILRSRYPALLQDSRPQLQMLVVRISERRSDLSL